MITKHFMQRSLSALILAPLVLYVVYLGGIAFTMMILLTCVLMSLEWTRIINSNTGIKLRPIHKFGWNVTGFVYVFMPCICLLYLRDLPNGLALTMWLILTVWATDIGAYIAGVSIGGPKIAPKISPKKTWAGLIGGMACAGLVGYLFDINENISFDFAYLKTGIIVALIAQAGDFLESGLKRHFNLKDSGELIPGHGGILDRVDGLVTAAVFVTLFVSLG